MGNRKIDARKRALISREAIKIYRLVARTKKGIEPGWSFILYFVISVITRSSRPPMAATLRMLIQLKICTYAPYASAPAHLASNKLPKNTSDIDIPWIKNV